MPAVRARRNRHRVHRCRQKGSILHCAFHAHGVADLDIAQRNRFAPLAKRGVLVGYEAMRSVVVHAQDGHLDAVDGGDFARQPGLPVVGLHLAHLLCALWVDLNDGDCTDGFGRGIGLAHGGNCVADLDVRRLDCLRRGSFSTFTLSALPSSRNLLQDARVHAVVNGVGLAGIGLDRVVVSRDRRHGPHEAATAAQHAATPASSASTTALPLTSRLDWRLAARRCRRRLLCGSGSSERECKNRGRQQMNSHGGLHGQDRACMGRPMEIDV